MLYADAPYSMYQTSEPREFRGGRFTGKCITSNDPEVVPRDGIVILCQYVDIQSFGDEATFEFGLNQSGPTLRVKAHIKNGVVEIYEGHIGKRSATRASGNCNTRFSIDKSLLGASCYGIMNGRPFIANFATR